MLPTLTIKKDRRFVYPFFISAILVLLFSCDTSDDAPECRLVSYRTEAMFFDDWNQALTVPDATFAGKFQVMYADGKPSGIHGGRVREYNGSQEVFHYRNEAESTISHYGDTVRVVLNSNWSTVPDTVSVVIRDGRLLYRRTVLNYPVLHSVEYVYEYQDNGNVLEYSAGNLTGTFIVQEGNLTEVHRSRYGLNGALTGTSTIVFSDYDDTPNYLKSNFYLPGAFYSAFSNHNFSQFQVTDFVQVNGETYPADSYQQNYDYAPGVTRSDYLFESSCD